MTNVFCKIEKEMLALTAEDKFVFPYFLWTLYQFPLKILYCAQFMLIFGLWQKSIFVPLVAITWKKSHIWSQTAWSHTRSASLPQCGLGLRKRWIVWTFQLLQGTSCHLLGRSVKEWLISVTLRLAKRPSWLYQHSVFRRTRKSATSDY